jgi:hypothetical protein
MLQLQPTILSLLLLCIFFHAAEAGTCGVPQTTKTYTCGIEWTAAIDYSGQLNFPQGTVISQGSGIFELSRPLTGTTSEIHIKKDTSSADITDSSAFVLGVPTTPLGGSFVSSLTKVSNVFQIQASSDILKVFVFPQGEIIQQMTTNGMAKGTLVQALTGTVVTSFEITHDTSSPDFAINEFKVWTFQINIQGVVGGDGGDFGMTNAGSIPVDWRSDPVTSDTTGLTVGMTVRQSFGGHADVTATGTVLSASTSQFQVYEQNGPPYQVIYQVLTLQVKATDEHQTFGRRIDNGDPGQAPYNTLYGWESPYAPYNTYNGGNLVIAENSGIPTITIPHNKIYSPSVSSSPPMAKTGNNPAESLYTFDMNFGAPQVTIPPSDIFSATSGVTLGCSLWKIGCSPWKKPILPSSEFTTTKDSTLNTYTYPDRWDSYWVGWEDMETAIKDQVFNVFAGSNDDRVAPQDPYPMSTLSNPYWKFAYLSKFTVTIDPMRFTTNKFRNQNGPSMIIGQGNQHTYVEADTSMFLLVFTLDGSSSFSFQKGFLVRQQNNFGNTILSGKLAADVSGNPTEIIVEFCISTTCSSAFQGNYKDAQEASDFIFPHSGYDPMLDRDLIITDPSDNMQTNVGLSKITGMTEKTLTCKFNPLVGPEPCTGWTYDDFDAVNGVKKSNANVVMTLTDGGVTTFDFWAKLTDTFVSNQDLILISNHGTQDKNMDIPHQSITSITNHAIDNTEVNAMCGMSFDDEGENYLIKGPLYIDDLDGSITSLTFGSCAQTEVTSIDPRSWTNGVETSMKALVLDDTAMVSPPDISALVNLERLSLSGDMKDGVLTSLPDISSLTKLKYFNVSRQLSITSIPSNYFEFNIELEEIVMMDLMLTALPADIFKFNTKLKVINMKSNQLTTITNTLLSTLSLLTVFDVRDNQILVDATSTWSPLLFHFSPQLKEVRLDNNKIKFIPKDLFKYNLNLQILGSTGTNMNFATATECPMNFYATSTFVPSVGIRYYACDPCVLDTSAIGTDVTYTCWTDYNDLTTHHAPSVCPRGNYCSAQTKTQVECPTGTYNLELGRGTLSSCINCDDGFYNPLPGQSMCPFQCTPGTFGAHDRSAAIDRSFCKVCPIGNYCFGQGVVEPTPCPKGKFSNQVSLKSIKECQDCASGFYGNRVELTSASMCTRCPTGTTSVAGSTTAQNCVDVPKVCSTANNEIQVGYRPSSSTSSNDEDLPCEACAAGQYGEDGQYCRLCPVGYVGQAEGASQCEKCDSSSSCLFVGTSIVTQTQDMEALPEWVSLARSKSTSSSSNLALSGAGGSATAGSGARLGSGLPNVTETASFADPTKNRSEMALEELLGLSLFLPIGLICLSILALHRYFPQRFCCCDIFSQHNEIQDTHAVRKVKSKMGGAFTWILLFVAVYLVFRSLANRTHSTSTSDAPERVTEFEQLVEQTRALSSYNADGFGRIDIEVDGYVPIDPKVLKERCEALTMHVGASTSHNGNNGNNKKKTNMTTTSEYLQCTLVRKTDVQTICGVVIQCETSFNIRGKMSVALSIPGEIQTLSWRVQAKTWEYYEIWNGDRDSDSGDGRKEWIRYQTSVNNTISVLGVTEVMKGTMEEPSTVEFGLTRGFAAGLSKASSGLQLGFTQSNIKKGLVLDSMPDLHVLSFDFDVTPALHIETTTNVLSNDALAATIFSLIMSAMKFISFTKKKLAQATDKIMLKRDNVPFDVKRRTELLHEENLMHRRFKKMMHKHGLKTQDTDGNDAEKMQQKRKTWRDSILDIHMDPLDMAALRKMAASSPRSHVPRTSFVDLDSGIELSSSLASTKESNAEMMPVTANPLNKSNDSAEKDEATVISVNVDKKDEPTTSTTITPAHPETLPDSKKEKEEEEKKDKEKLDETSAAPASKDLIELVTTVVKENRELKVLMVTLAERIAFLEDHQFDEGDDSYMSKRNR